MTRYSQLAAWRKPELIDPTSFPMGEDVFGRPDGGKFRAMVDRWTSLRHDLIGTKIISVTRPKQNAFYQLVEHPILAMSNLYELYYDVGAQPGARVAGGFARRHPRRPGRGRVQARPGDHRPISRAQRPASGDGMMLQTHIGYTTWQQPEKQVMPEVRRTNLARNVAGELVAGSPRVCRE